MSNLSDIGFPVKSDKDVNDILMKVMQELTQIPCPPRGFYYLFSDESGAELFLQADSAQDMIGFNPAFWGKSRRQIGLTKGIERDTSELDGAFYGWANPRNKENPGEAGEHQIVFDVPDFRLHEKIVLPKTADVQLTAFASNDFRIFESEDDYFDSQSGEKELPVRSFAASALFGLGQAEENAEEIPPQAHGMISGEIKEFGIRTNGFTHQPFYWFLIETLGGEIDVVADPKFVTAEPAAGQIISGSFWISGKILG
ncbi:MAG: hypothetical protein R2681_07680 [Pyrinomonadaceae bacterium]